MKIKQKDYWKKEDFEEFKLPPVSRFKGSVKNKMGPWDKLQKWFIANYGIDQAKVLYKELFLQESTANKFEKEVMIWAKKISPKMTKKYYERQVGYYNLLYSPCYFFQDPPWAKKGMAYIRKNFKTLNGKVEH